MTWRKGRHFASEWCVFKP